jgi:hypothetical protein
MGFEIIVDASDEIWGVIAQAFTVQNDEVADAVTDLIKDSRIRIEM